MTVARDEGAAVAFDVGERPEAVHLRLEDPGGVIEGLGDAKEPHGGELAPGETSMLPARRSTPPQPQIMRHSNETARDDTRHRIKSYPAPALSWRAPASRVRRRKGRLRLRPSPGASAKAGNLLRRVAGT